MEIKLENGLKMKNNNMHVENKKTRTVKNIDFCFSLYSLSQYHLFNAQFKPKPKIDTIACILTSIILKIPNSVISKWLVYSGMSINPASFVDNGPML